MIYNKRATVKVPRFGWRGWITGPFDEDWLEITDNGEEYARIVLDTSIYETAQALATARAVRKSRATQIVKALNAGEKGARR